MLLLNGIGIKLINSVYFISYTDVKLKWVLEAPGVLIFYLAYSFFYIYLYFIYFFWGGYGCAAGNFDHHPVKKNTDEPNLQRIKTSFLFYPPINKLQHKFDCCCCCCLCVCVCV